jgi:hypothetical protein
MKMTLTYFIVPYGVSSGLPALMLRPFKGEKDYSFSEMIEQITKGFTTTNMKVRLLAIDSTGVDEVERDLTDLVKLLDYVMTNRINLIHYVGDVIWPSYVRMGGLVKMNLVTEVEKDWTDYPINEVFWYPTEKEQEEPPLKGLERAARYVVPNGPFTVADMLRFLSDECEAAWAVAMPLRKTVEITLND